MKIKILKENFSQAINLAGKFASSKTQVPGLSMMVIKAKDKEVYVYASDLDRGLKLRVGAKVEVEGEVAIPAKILAELIQTMPLGAVELEKTEGELLMRAGRMKVNLQIGDGEVVVGAVEGQVEGESMGEFELKELVRVWDRVKFAVSRDDARPVLTGVLWEFGKGRVVATDGYRLSVVSKIMKVKSEKIALEQLLIPAGLWQELVKVLTDKGIAKIEILLNAAEGRVIFKAEDVWVLGRLIEGEYPNYRAILPTDFATRLRVDRQQFLEAVKGATIFARETSNIVKLVGVKNELLMTANSSQLGGGEMGVEVLAGEMGEFEVAFNSRYLTDYLTATANELVEIGINEALQPVGFRAVGSENEEHVIMPVRVKG